MKKEEKKTLIMKNGKKFTVIDENDKYYICKDTRFKKNNKEIAKVDIKKIKEETEKVETEIEEA